MKLKEYLFPEHLDYVELEYDSSANNATVKTQKPLDVDSIEVLLSLHIKLVHRKAVHQKHQRGLQYPQLCNIYAKHFQFPVTENLLGPRQSRWFLNCVLLLSNKSCKYSINIGS